MTPIEALEALAAVPGAAWAGIFWGTEAPGGPCWCIKVMVDSPNGVCLVAKEYSPTLSPPLLEHRVSVIIAQMAREREQGYPGG